MSDYIVDSENQDLAILSGTYTTDSVNKVITFGTDGQADTEFILPTDSSWILIEVYNVEGVAGDVGYTKWSSNTYNISTRIASARTTALAEYTTFDIVCTYYKGTGYADVYRGDEATAMALASGDTDIMYTPSGTNWLITDTREAPNHNIVDDPTFANNGASWSSTDSNYLVFQNNRCEVANNKGLSVGAHASHEALVSGQTYDIQCDVSGWTGGNYRFYLGNAVYSGFMNGNGTKTAQLTWSGDLDEVWMQFLDGTYLYMDNFYCTPVK